MHINPFIIIFKKAVKELGISAIVVTYNRLNMLKECLYQLLNQSYKLDNIFVINNNSSDGTKQYLSKFNNSIIKPINSHKNLGGAGGFSLGTELAYKYSKSDYFWLMDDDTMPTKDALKNLVKASDKLNGNFGFLCSNVRWWKNHEPCNKPTVSRGGWTKYAKYGLIGVREATFVSFLVPRIMVRKYGLPLAKAFIWGDDTEYSSRLSHRAPSYFVSNSIIIHKAANPDLSCNNLITETSNNRIARYKYMYRNRLFVERKYESLHSFMKWLATFILIFLKIPFKAKDRRIKRMFYDVDGIITGLFFNPKIKFPNKM